MLLHTLNIFKKREQKQLLAYYAIVDIHTLKIKKISKTFLQELGPHKQN